VATVEEASISKGVILYNFEDLSVDAQSALRRCNRVIFEHHALLPRRTAREHLVAILSRLAHIYPLPIINGALNLHTFHIQRAA
jgi:hypothetical protein